ncbi:sulfite exporter TauE/SafE family protein [Chitinilyticum piscinae]|uniref:Probable membrane transporter protein n=1 Tax=Chitinilyticum piscinae TaxID=2866724 RepID=A0A8J7FHP8_9NEIS|nr:sulfite exporter TauE/SafE family protein [Chitinilyticum piscinae]MBE9607967.1 sulfite exporter TauE/SafE family protein [Chitinilyticum piscinae]
MLDSLLLFAVSLVANTLSALAGGGAGLLQLPILLFLGLAFPVALATHKLASVALGVGATLKHLRSGTLNLRFSALILAAGLPGVVLGAHLILRIPDQWALLALAILTTGLGIHSLLTPELGLQAIPRNRAGWRLAAGALVLFLIGVLNGSLTSGTGLFVTLWLVYWYGLEYKRAVAYTLVLVGLFWNGAGAAALAAQAGIYWPWVPVLLVASVLGGYLGAHWALVKGNRLVKRCFELVTLLTGLSLFIKAF